MEKILSVQVDLDPSLEKLLIVRSLGQRHEDLIPYFRNDEVDIHAAKHSGLQGLEHRLVGHEIRRGDLDLLASAVDQGNDETLVVLGGKIRSTRQDLSGNWSGDFGTGKNVVALEYFVGFQEPIRGENILQLQNGWTPEAALT